MIRIPTHRQPTHPGEMLDEEFLRPMKIPYQELSEAIHMSRQDLEGIIQNQENLTPSTALRLARYFGTSADFWMNLQLRWDLYHAQQSDAKTIESIRPRQLA